MGNIENKILIDELNQKNRFRYFITAGSGKIVHDPKKCFKKYIRLKGTRNF
jgi:hypothetical protein